MALNTHEIRAAVRRAAAAMRAAEDELKAADRVLGDGDTGQTARRMLERTEADANPNTRDLSTYFHSAGRAGATATGSSLGTLISVSRLEASKALKHRTELETSEIGGLLARIEETVLARGRVAVGDKMVADTLHAVGSALRETKGDPVTIARQASFAALEELRARPSSGGRARMYAEKTFGRDDPGMLVLNYLITAVTSDA